MNCIFSTRRELKKHRVVFFAKTILSKRKAFLLNYKRSTRNTLRGILTSSNELKRPRDVLKRTSIYSKSLAMFLNEIQSAQKTTRELEKPRFPFSGKTISSKENALYLKYKRS